MELEERALAAARHVNDVLANKFGSALTRPARPRPTRATVLSVAHHVEDSSAVGGRQSVEPTTHGAPRQARASSAPPAYATQERWRSGLNQLLQDGEEVATETHPGPTRATTPPRTDSRMPTNFRPVPRPTPQPPQAAEGMCPDHRLPADFPGGTEQGLLREPAPGYYTTIRYGNAIPEQGDAARYGRVQYAQGPTPRVHDPSSRPDGWRGHMGPPMHQGPEAARPKHPVSAAPGGVFRASQTAPGVRPPAPAEEFVPLEVICPQGVGPGDVFQMVSQSRCHLLQVAVPNGVCPGEMFVVPIPMATSATVATPARPPMMVPDHSSRPDCWRGHMGPPAYHGPAAPGSMHPGSEAPGMSRLAMTERRLPSQGYAPPPVRTSVAARGPNPHLVPVSHLGLDRVAARRPNPHPVPVSHMGWPSAPPRTAPPGTHSVGVDASGGDALQPPLIQPPVGLRPDGSDTATGGTGAVVPPVGPPPVVPAVAPPVVPAVVPPPPVVLALAVEDPHGRNDSSDTGVGIDDSGLLEGEQHQGLDDTGGDVQPPVSAAPPAPLAGSNTGENVEGELPAQEIETSAPADEAGFGDSPHPEESAVVAQAETDEGTRELLPDESMGLSDEDAVTRNPISRNSEETPRRLARNCPSPRGHQGTLDDDLQLPENCELLGYLGRVQDHLKALVQHGEPCIPPEHFIYPCIPPAVHSTMAMEDAEDPTESVEIHKSTLAHSRTRSRSMPARREHQKRKVDDKSYNWRSTNATTAASSNRTAAATLDSKLLARSTNATTIASSKRTAAATSNRFGKGDKACGSCGTMITTGALFCSGCGKAVRECPGCRVAITYNRAYCCRLCPGGHTSTCPRRYSQGADPTQASTGSSSLGGGR